MVGEEITAGSSMSAGELDAEDGSQAAEGAEVEWATSGLRWGQEAGIGISLGSVFAQKVHGDNAGQAKESELRC